MLVDIAVTITPSKVAISCLAPGRQAFLSEHSPLDPRPLPGGRMQPDTHLGPGSQPTRLCVFVCVCVCICVCVGSGVLTAQLRLTDGIISRTDRKAGCRKPGCV